MSGLGFLKTHHSYHEGTGRTSDYIKAASDRGIDKLVLCDRVSLADMIEFYDLSTKAGIEPIMGSMFKLSSNERLFEAQLGRNKPYFEALRCFYESLGLPSALYNGVLLELFDGFDKNIVAPQIKIYSAKKPTAASIETAKRNISGLIIEAVVSKLDSEEQRSDTVTLLDSIRNLKKKDKITSLFSGDFTLTSSSNDDEKSSDFESAFWGLIEKSGDYKLASEECYSDLLLINGTDVGFQSLKNLVSWSYMHGQEPSLVKISNKKRKVYSHPKLPYEYLLKGLDGVVAVIGLFNDELGKAIRYKGDVAEAIAFYKKIFGDKLLIAVERSSTNQDGYDACVAEFNFNEKLLDVSAQYSIPAIAFNHALFVNAEDYEVHDVKSCIILEQKLDDVTREKSFRHNQYLRSWEEITASFQDLPQLVSNAERIVNFFETVFGDERSPLSIELDVPVLPQFPIPEGYTTTSYMEHLAYAGVQKRLKKRFLAEYGCDDVSVMPPDVRVKAEALQSEYEVRLKYEVGVIDSMGFPGYFLIVSDFIVWAKENGIPVGPGRGSGAGSIVAYGLSITNIDPIKHDLLFERFLNPERVSMPDFDVDFGSGFHPETKELMTRDSVIHYVADMYNNPESLFPSVAQIATHGLLAAKSGFKAVSKVHGQSVRFGEDFTSLFPDDPEVNVGKCLEVDSVQKRIEIEPVTKLLMELTEACEGLKKSSGLHAGGVVIADGSITKFSSVQSDAKDVFKLATQTDKNAVERAGLVKFDFLGLLNLTTMSFAVRNIEKRHGVRIDIDDIDMGDPEVFKLLKSANSHGLFQVESAGMRELLRRLSVDDIEDLSALCALFRPGPLQSGMVDNFIDRKHGREEISYPDSKYQHELLEPILRPTYGIILYQEQVMQIAQVLAGYSLGGADLLRRAMGKKKPEEMAKQRAVFESGAKAKGIDSELAVRIFDLVEKFAGYGFNKSHSMAYAYIAYQTAWLKTHYPCEYMAAVLSSQMDNHDKLKATLIDCKNNGLEILPPDINLSGSMFEPEGENSIRYGLGAIRGVGQKNLVKIIAERERNGHFKNVPEIAFRCRSAFDAKVSDSLVMSGALDSLDTTLPITKEPSDLEAISPKPEEKSEHEDALEAILNQRDRLDIIRDEGVELLKMIDSLTIHYSERYGLNLEPNLPVKERVNRLWAFFGDLLEQNLVEEDIEHGSEMQHVKIDFESLVHQVCRRSDLSQMYVRENAEYQSLIKLHGDPDGLIRKVEAAKQQKAIESKEPEVLPPLKNSVESLPSFQLRPYLQAEVKFMSQFKVKDFKDLDDPMSLLDELSYKEVTQISDKDRLVAEFERLSLFTTGHPLDVGGLRKKLAKRHKTTRLDKVIPSSVDGDGEITNRRVYAVAGVVEMLRVLKVKKQGKNFGREMAILTLSDSFGSINVAVFPDIYAKVKSSIYLNEPMCVKGTVVPNHKGEDTPDLQLDEVFDCNTGEHIFKQAKGGWQK